jgi:hypothetical protein
VAGANSVYGYVTYTSGAENGNTFYFYQITPQGDGTHDLLKFFSSSSAGATDTFNLFISPALNNVYSITADRAVFASTISTPEITGLSTLDLINFVTSGASNYTQNRAIRATGAGVINYLTYDSLQAFAGATCYGNYLIEGALSTTSKQYGVTFVNGDVGVNDPTVDQISIFNNNQVNKTDANMKKWFIKNTGAYVGSKVLLGMDGIKTYWGTGADASINYDGTDLCINTKEVGSGTIKINGVAAFSGTGSYTNFTITDGIITAAS